MGTLEEELQKIYDSEIHVDIGWIWDGGIDVSIGNGADSIAVFGESSVGA